jgi:hypothetical protein
VVTAVLFARGEVNRKPPAIWLASLTLVGLLDRTATGYRVHDWDEMQTTHVEAEEKRRAQARERQRRHRDGSRSVTRDVTRDSVTEKEKEKEREKETEGDRTVSLNSRSSTPSLIVSRGEA